MAITNIYRRLKFYLLGLGLGVIFVWLIFYKNKDNTTWLPESRIKQFLSNTELLLSLETENKIKKLNFSIAELDKDFWKNIKINFKQSEVTKKPCPNYNITGKLTNNKTVVLWIEFCEFCAGCPKESTATLLDIKYK